MGMNGVIRDEPDIEIGDPVQYCTLVNRETDSYKLPVLYLGPDSHEATEVSVHHIGTETLTFSSTGELSAYLLYKASQFYYRIRTFLNDVW